MLKAPFVWQHSQWLHYALQIPIFFRAKNFGPPRILVVALLAVQDAGVSVVSLALTDNFVFRLPAFVQLRALDFAAVGWASQWFLRGVAFFRAISCQ